MAAHSRILPWEIPWTEWSGGLQSMGLQRVRQDLATKRQKGGVGSPHVPPISQEPLRWKPS